MADSARIDSPEIVRTFRGRFAAFENLCRNALRGVEAEVKRTGEWLRGEQLNFWQKELRKRHDQVDVANGHYQRMKLGSNGQMTTQMIDAKKALDKARRRHEEAERKLALTKGWAGRLETELEKQMAMVKSFAILLDELGPNGLARLDQMAEALDRYLETPGGSA